MAVTLSQIAQDAALSAVCALLNGGSLVIVDGTRTLVTFTLHTPACETITDAGAELIDPEPAFGIAKGTPTAMRAFTASGDLVISGSTRGVTFDPPEILAGARVTASGVMLGGVA